MKREDLIDEFELQDQDGHSVTLSDLVVDGPTVLYYFVKAMTPGCTVESTHFRDLRSEFAEHGATIVGVSADPVDRHKMFDVQNKLGFPVLSDPDKTVAAILGVKRFGPMPPKRATFVIGTDKRLIGSIASETNMNKHADDALAMLASMESENS